MDTRSLKVGDRIRCNVRGLAFTATLDGRVEGLWLISATRPTMGMRTVTSRQIVGKVEGQERLEVGA